MIFFNAVGLQQIFNRLFVGFADVLLEICKDASADGAVVGCENLLQLCFAEILGHAEKEHNGVEGALDASVQGCGVGGGHEGGVFDARDDCLGFDELLLCPVGAKAAEYLSHFFNAVGANVLKRHGVGVCRDVKIVHLGHFLADGGHGCELEAIGKQGALPFVGGGLDHLPLVVAHHGDEDVENVLFCGEIKGQVARADACLAADGCGGGVGKSFFKKQVDSHLNDSQTSGAFFFYARHFYLRWKFDTSRI